MKAWIFRRYGGPEVLEWTELAEPVPRKGEILVRVVAAALNPLDWKLRAGHADGASLPGAGITAVQSLRDARLAAGKRVLVVGAAGGVGSFAVQLAKDAGAQVTAVASTAAQAFLARLAPERTIDYQREDWKALGEPFDIVFDASGTSTLPECRRLLAPGGTYVHTLPNAALFGWSWWLKLTAKERCVPVMERPNRADLETLVRLAAAGRIQSVVTRTGRPEDVPALQRAMEGGHNRGKIVVRFAPDP